MRNLIWMVRYPTVRRNMTQQSFKEGRVFLASLDGWLLTVLDCPETDENRGGEINTSLKRFSAFTNRNETDYWVFVQVCRIM